MLKTRHIAKGLRDMVFGLLVFTAIAIGACGNGGSWSLAAAVASDRGLPTANDAGAFAATLAENGDMASLMMATPFAPHDGRGFHIFILCLSFSVMFAFNLAILRHLRREYASPRRGEWRRGR